MISRKIVAVFDSRDSAQRALDSLRDLGIANEHMSISDRSSSERTVENSQVRGGFWSHIQAMFMPERDRHTIEESVRRGGYVLVATVEEERVNEAVSRIERAGSVDLEAREDEWRAGGWSPSESVSDSDDLSEEATPAEPGSNRRAGVEEQSREATVPVVSESLRVGKREVNRGSVRVRSYIVEEPVHEQVRLREEHVNVERRPVRNPAPAVPRGSEDDTLQERTVEVSETAEQAVVGKEARVSEEVVVSKTANDRIERIDDTVRRTEVEVQDGREGAQPDRAKDRPTRTPGQPRGA